MNENPEIKCPACGSDDVSKAKFTPKAFAISVLLLGFPFPFVGRKHHCFSCGHDFKKKEIKNKNGSL